MAERPTVLLVGKGPPEVGGIPAFLEALRSSSLAERFDLRFLNLARGGARAGGRASLANLARSATDAAAVFRAARDADLVHVHSALAPGVTLLRAGLLVSAGRAAGAKVVLHAHGGRIQLWLEGERRLRLARAALRPAHAVVAVSRGAQNALAPARPDVVLVRNGVDLTRFRPRGEGSPPEPGGPPTVLFVGGLTPRKGVLDLFAASDALLARGIDHRLVLAGGIPDEGPEAERAVRDAVPAQARLLGPVAPDHVAELLQSADVFCLPSWWEAMPLSVLEAMASGVAVVATAVGDVPDLLADGAGVVVAPRDPDALAEALATLLTAPDARRSIVAAGRRRVEEDYPLSRTIDQLTEVFERALGR